MIYSSFADNFSLPLVGRVGVGVALSLNLLLLAFKFGATPTLTPAPQGGGKLVSDNLEHIGSNSSH